MKKFTKEEYEQIWKDIVELGEFPMPDYEELVVDFIFNPSPDHPFVKVVKEDIPIGFEEDFNERILVFSLDEGDYDDELVGAMLEEEGEALDAAEAAITAALVILGEEQDPDVEITPERIIFKGKWEKLNEAFDSARDIL